MTFVDLITNGSAGERRGILIAATLAGIANAVLLVLVNVVAESPHRAGLRSFGMFALAIILYILGARRTYYRTGAVIEGALHRIKTSIVDKIGRADVQGLERLGTAEIYDRITENVSVVSGAAGVVANLLQSLCILVFATLYIAWLSLAAFAVLALLLAVGLIIYWSKEKEMRAYLQHLAQARLSFFEKLTDLLEGSKEARFSQRRSRELRDDIVQTSDSLRAITVKANNLFDENWIFAKCNLFAMLGALVYVLPRHIPVDGVTLSKLVGGVMFMWGPVSGIAGGVPAYVRSNQALAEIQALEDKLDAAVRRGGAAADAEDPWEGHLSAIEAHDIEYEYSSENGSGTFRVGPLNLTVTAGEVVFIVGGNGSGKSTLLKVLTGLYPSSAGALLVDGTLIQPENVAAYREMISAIYSDFHLFTKLYGLLDVEAASVHRLLAQMQLEGKTSFTSGRFTRRDLSTGQRKRLAMIVALLEDRPLYVFDEWAADQDPEFRRYFYEELIPALKQQGKTVLAVSHDDRYFHCADRVVKMEYGKIRSIERAAERLAAQVNIEQVAGA